MVVVFGIDGFGDLALDFEPDEERFEERRARRALAFGDGQGGGKFFGSHAYGPHSNLVI